MTGNSLHSAEMGSKEAEIGYWIGRPYWGQGLIPEATMALLHRSFDELGFDTVWIGYYDGNNNSRRVCEKCGLTYHHTNEDVKSPLGDLRTEHFYKMTRSQFHQQQKP